MTNQVIPAEAVKAALIVLRRDDLWELSDEEEARLILEAAAPHMLAGAKADGWRSGYEQGWQDGQTAERTGEDFGPQRTNPYAEAAL